jgi:Copper binding proteins, plastocyanin/azurin family
MTPSRSPGTSALHWRVEQCWAGLSTQRLPSRYNHQPIDGEHPGSMAEPFPSAVRIAWHSDQITFLFSLTVLGLFRPTAAGTYTFYCSGPGHCEAGMVGTLIVEP